MRKPKNIALERLLEELGYDLDAVLRNTDKGEKDV